MANPLTIVGILVEDRAERAPEMQAIITKYGGDILSRMGISSPDREKGLITLVMESEVGQVRRFQWELEAIPGLAVQTLTFPQ